MSIFLGKKKNSTEKQTIAQKRSKKSKNTIEGQFGTSYKNTQHLLIFS